MVGFDGLKPIIVVAAVTKKWSVQIVFGHLAGDTLGSVMGV